MSTITTSPEAERAAASIRSAYSDEAPAPWVRNTFDAGDIDAAYAVQLVNTRHWLGMGRRIVGYKIGLTSPSVQKQLGVDQPDFGVLFADMANSDGEQIEVSRLRKPRVEAEVGLMMSRNIERDDLTLAELVSAVEYAVAAIEVVDTRFESWKISLADTIADNASAGRFVIGGKPTRLFDTDLGAATMAMTIGGKVVSEGRGSDCLGNPLSAALWLARTLSKLGTPVQAGHFIMTGALGPMVDVNAGCDVVCDIKGLGSVRCQFV
jgi:2-keto-4-pentenoate hydratase